MLIVLAIIIYAWHYEGFDLLADFRHTLNTKTSQLLLHSYEDGFPNKQHTLDKESFISSLSVAVWSYLLLWMLYFTSDLSLVKYYEIVLATILSHLIYSNQSIR